MASLSTHVLDTSLGRPAEGIRISLESPAGELIAEGHTNTDGRIAPLGPESFAPGEYVVRFDTGGYLGADAFYPEVVVHFVAQGDQHYHVPLLLNPFGYSTYRGS